MDLKNIIQFQPITPELYPLYIHTGIKAYTQHYLHLWPNENASPYLETSFTSAVLEKEEANSNTILYVIKCNNNTVGIFKINLNERLDSYTATDALYLDKIYILKEWSGKGIGKKVLQFVCLRAKELNKKIVWLATMQKGPALQYYLNNGFTIKRETEITLPSVLEDEKLMWILTKKI